MARETGGPAFPRQDVVWTMDNGTQTGTEGHPGMTLRDYFAAKAMQGILSAWYQTKDKNVMHDDKMGTFAYWSYGMADAMIAERAKGE